MVDAQIDLAAIGFELGFTRPAGADTAAKLAHGLALAGQARQLVLELRKLNLQLAFARAGVAGEDVQNELGAIDHAAFQPRFEVAHLRGRQVVIEEHQVGAARGDHAVDLVDFACTHECGGVRAGAALDQGGGDFGSGGTRQLFELRQRSLEIEIGHRLRRNRIRVGLRHGFIVARQQSRGLPGQARCRGQLAPLAGKFDGHQHGSLCAWKRQASAAGRLGRSVSHLDRPAHSDTQGVTFHIYSPEGLWCSTAATAWDPEAWERLSECELGRPLTTVEMACLKMSCSWLLFSSRTEYLSKDRIFPVNLTPLTR